MESRIVDGHLPAVRTLLAVVDAGSLTDAGRRLGLSPSGVSKQIARLEEVLGARLLARTTRQVKPTLAGLELCHRVRPLFEAFEDAERAVRDLDEQIAGAVRISAAPAFGRAVLVPVMNELSRAHPALRFQVTLTGRRLDFVEDELDLAVREGALRDSTLTARKLGTATVGLYASSGYLVSRGKPRSLADLARHDLLTTVDPGAMSTLLGQVHPEVRRLEIVPRFQVDDLTSIAMLAEAGAGIAALPDYVAAPMVTRGALTRVLARTEIARLPVLALYPSRRHLPRRVEVVMEALSNASRTLM
jgi:DNA-binding transcriptional LysR family regulator